MKTKSKKIRLLSSDQPLKCEAKKWILVLIPLKAYILNRSLFDVNYLKGNLKYFPPPRNFENSALTPIELLFGLAFRFIFKNL